MSSHNHPAFTSVGAWFYTDLVGIRVDTIREQKTTPTIPEPRFLLGKVCRCALFCASEEVADGEVQRSFFNQCTLENCCVRKDSTKAIS
eukprot:4584366-Amphidinium_carterae.1